MTIYPDERNQELTTKQNEITLKTSRLFGVILAVLSAIFVFAVIKLGINENTNELACAEVEANALLQKAGKAAMLTLSAETRPMRGGVVLKDGLVETNCSIGTMISGLRAALSGKVAACLFG